MIDNDVQIAKYLLEINAIKLQPTHPFTWASGWKSPIYCDNRIALSHPTIRNYIKQKLSEKIIQVYGTPQYIAGVATAAIAQGALVADLMGLPFIYVRSAPKDHGRTNLIEGEIKPSSSVVVIEDLVSTGMSSLKAVEALRNVGCEVKGLISIFNYGFDTAKAAFQKADCAFTSLCDYQTLINYASSAGHITADQLTLLTTWSANPANWNK
ncbi:MAG: hypothetical protein RIQ89_496 [Bacteroidota bacterium]